MAGQQTPPHDINNLSMADITRFMQIQLDPKRFIVRVRFKHWSDVLRKPKETPQELAARVRQQVATCDFASIKDQLEEALHRKRPYSLQNER